MQLHATTCLKLHAHAITRLHDPNWTGMDLFDELKQWARGRRDPVNLFKKIIKDGVLFRIGKLLLEDYFDHDSRFGEIEGEYKLWFIEDVMSFYKHHWPRTQLKLVEQVSHVAVEIDQLYIENEEEYFGRLESEDFANWFNESVEANQRSRDKRL